tara:strand:- start:314 stop:1006 length:693 start_codon:yes stop_codon:yes gene_type:complete
MHQKGVVMNSCKYLLMTLLFCFLTNAKAVKIDSDLEKFSYSMGVIFGQTVTRQELEIDVPAFMQAVEDVLNKSEKKLNDDEMQEIINQFTKKEQEERKAMNKNNETDGENFLAKNKNKEGVIVLPSGLQYEIIKMGNGEKPNINSTVVVHYRGTLIDGTEFDSSYARGEPIELNLGQVIKGWQEALQLMPVGSKWKTVIPSTLAYGERGAGRMIGPNATLLFDIELISIK